VPDPEVGTVVALYVASNLNNPVKWSRPLKDERGKIKAPASVGLSRENESISAIGLFLQTTTTTEQFTLKR